MVMVASIAAGGTIADMTTPQPAKPDASKAAALHVIARWCLLALAVLSLLLGVVGLFLPLLPTVPFLLLAAWAAGYSSPRLSHWLENHPRLGPPITDWRRAGVVSRRAKWMATIAMIASAFFALVLLGPHWAALATMAMMACVLAWLWQRPERAMR